VVAVDVQIPAQLALVEVEILRLYRQAKETTVEMAHFHRPILAVAVVVAQEQQVLRQPQTALLAVTVETEAHQALAAAA
jgi:hypothetical protein